MANSLSISSAAFLSPKPSFLALRLLLADVAASMQTLGFDLASVRSSLTSSGLPLDCSISF